MIRAILVDDEKHCLETLSWQLSKFCPEVEVVATSDNAEKALGILRETEIDLVFLDIEMPVMNGFELLQHFKQVPFEIIFTTAYDIFAVKAFKFSALDYLLKPIDKDELLLAVNKAINKKQPILPEQLNILFQNLYQQTHSSNKIALPTMEGLEFISASDIVFCQSDGNYTHIFMLDGSRYLISRTLKETEELLEGHKFLRVHHSYTINLDHIRKYVKGDGGYVIMSNRATINVSRSRKDELLRMFH